MSCQGKTGSVCLLFGARSEGGSRIFQVGLKVLQGRNLHLKVKGLTEQRSGDCEVWGLNGAQSQRREIARNKAEEPAVGVFL